MEISGYGGHVGSEANTIDLSSVHHRQQHTLISNPDAGHHGQPNIFQLEKLVEVTHYNMDSRPRLVFYDIWTLISGHLTSTALHSNAAVAMYAVDSFRQLSTQFLQREELGGFEFQRKFLKPLETVMARCQHASIKELLLKCIERIILMFGSGSDEEASDPKLKPMGTLRSGWRPVLTVLGLAGRDESPIIAQMGFRMLTAQLRQCLCVEKDPSGIDKPRAGSLLSDRFVDLVDALLMYVGGPHEAMSIVSIDHLVTLSTFLADDSFALPLVRKRSSIIAKSEEEAKDEGARANAELELWWPILLGLARSIGDPREQVRLKSFITLLGVINQHFFPDGTESDGSSKYCNIQTLQLIFRGVLTPVLDHAEIDARSGPMPPLPDDFVRFITRPAVAVPKERNTTWLETTFEHFMDGCIAICMRSIQVFRDDCLVEEIFGMLNSCLLSDSGALAVRGLRRLHMFVTNDLGPAKTTDDTWATVCHMLRRSMSVRGLPPSFARNSSKYISREDSSNTLSDQQEVFDSASQEEDDSESIVEFISEERVLSDRRYIGANAALVIGSLLTDAKHSASMGLRWRLFLTTGLGRGVQEWEYAAKLLLEHSVSPTSAIISPPNYEENSIYGRKWLNKLLLQLVSVKDKDTQSSSSANAALSIQSVIREQTQSLLSAYLEKDAFVEGSSEVSHGQPWDKKHAVLLTELVKELVNGYSALDDETAMRLSTLLTMFSSCMQASDENLRLEIHTLVRRVFPHVNPKPAEALLSPQDSKMTL
jgi:brefeldin A-inhibited guanine nucleotide-exchange protein